MKRYRILIAVVFGIVAVTWLGLDRSRTIRGGDEPKKPVTVPVDGIYTTCDEHSPKYLNYGERHAGFATFTMLKGSLNSGASNVFLVRGDDIDTRHGELDERAGIRLQGVISPAACRRRQRVC